MKKILIFIAFYSLPLVAMDDKVMPGPWCVLFTGLKSKMIRHANFKSRGFGYGCDDTSEHKLHLLALDSEYAILVYGEYSSKKNPPTIQKVLVAAENQQQYEAGNHQIIVLRSAESKSWDWASKYDYSSRCLDAQSELMHLSNTPVVHNASWEKIAFDNNGNNNNNINSVVNNNNNGTVEWLTASDWVKWAQVSEPYAIQDQLTKWDTPVLERLRRLKTATLRAALFCYINQKLHPNDLATVNTRYQNEIKYLEGLGRLWIKSNSKVKSAISDTILMAGTGGAMGAITGPIGAGLGAIVGGLAGIKKHVVAKLDDEDEYKYGRTD